MSNPVTTHGKKFSGMINRHYSLSQQIKNWKFCIDNKEGVKGSSQTV